MLRASLAAILVVSAAWAAVAPSPAKDGGEVANSLGMKFRAIPPGKFTMGAPAGEGRENDTQHEVEITRPFYLQVHDVTQAEYQKVTGNNPSHFCKTGLGRFRVDGIDTARFPVENVSWQDAVVFCRTLSALQAEKNAGRTYRLPTEAEWEYACRASGKTSYANGKSLDSRQANFNGNYPGGDGPTGPYLQRPCPVGSYKPNAFGLYDMHGNVWQWCADRYDRDYYAKSPRKDPPGPDTGKKHVLRGGSWLNRGRDCRASDRLSLEPDEKYNNVGFRVVCQVSTARSKR